MSIRGSGGTSSTVPASAPALPRGRFHDVPAGPRFPPEERFHTPEPSPVRLSRKRAASMDLEEVDRPRPRPLTLLSPEGAGKICLCTPAPKIRRPRNAFILYRQHHQSNIVHENPGIPNPDISKIIGQQWRKEPEEVKNRWKMLAEEDKRNHQRQYPNYKYQPRRGRKLGPGGVPLKTPTLGDGSAGGDHPGADQCPNCGGRYITTPSTPSLQTPSQLAAPDRRASRQPSLGPHMMEELNMAARSRNDSYGSITPLSATHGATRALAGVSLSSPYSAGRPPSRRPDYRHRPSQDYGAERPSPAARDPKRARLDGEVMRWDGRGVYPGPDHGYNYPQPPTARGTRHPSLGSPMVPPPGYAAYGPPQPGPNTWTPQDDGAYYRQLERQQHRDQVHRDRMAPPPRPAVHAPQASPTSRRHATPPFDTSLRLPPLNTELMDAARSPGRPELINRPGTAGTVHRPSEPYAQNARQHHAPQSQAQAHAQSQPQPQPPRSAQTQQQRSPETEDRRSSEPGQPPEHQQLMMSQGPPMPASSRREIERRSVEAMIMNIDYRRKLEVLERISPPIALPAPGSPSAAEVETRGPVIAIEGLYPDLMPTVAEVIRGALVGRMGGRCVVREWRDAEQHTGGGEGRVDAGSAVAAGNDRNAEEQGDGKSREDAKNGSAMTFHSYLGTAQAWHSTSQEIIKFVTTKPLAPSPASGPGKDVSRDSTLSPAPPSTSHRSAPPSRVGTPASAADKTITVTGPAAAASSSASSIKDDGTTAPKTNAAAAAAAGDLIPVALLPSGFRLNITDRYASSVPIADNYAPIDHWQWVATLWRGIVAPDLTVFVRRSRADDVERFGSVELKSPGLMVVRVPYRFPGGGKSGVTGEKGGEAAGDGQGEKKAASTSRDDGFVDEETRRAVADAVVKWMEAGSFRRGF